MLIPVVGGAGFWSVAFFLIVLSSSHLASISPKTPDLSGLFLLYPSWLCDEPWGSSHMTQLSRWDSSIYFSRFRPYSEWMFDLNRTLLVFPHTAQLFCRRILVASWVFNILIYFSSYNHLWWPCDIIPHFPDSYTASIPCLYWQGTGSRHPTQLGWYAGVSMAAVLCGTYVYSLGWRRPCPVYLGISSYFHCHWISQYLQFFVCGGDEGEEDKGEEDDEAAVRVTA